MNKEYQKLRQISTVLKKILFHPSLPPTKVSYFGVHIATRLLHLTSKDKQNVKLQMCTNPSLSDWG